MKLFGTFLMKLFFSKRSEIDLNTKEMKEKKNELDDALEKKIQMEDLAKKESLKITNELIALTKKTSMLEEEKKNISHESSKFSFILNRKMRKKRMYFSITFIENIEIFSIVLVEKYNFIFLLLFHFCRIILNRISRNNRMYFSITFIENIEIFSMILVEKYNYIFFHFSFVFFFA